MRSDHTGPAATTHRDALILVDLQNDFLPGGALAVPQGDEVIDVANRLQPLFALVVATRDWHPKNHGSFAASHPGRRAGDVGELAGIPQVFWPTHCVQQSTGAELASSLEAASERVEVLKGQQVDVDSYSAFFDNGRRHQTELDQLLRSRGVQRVFVLGLATDYCVKHTALDALELGYETYLVVDGCRGVNQTPRGGEAALREMQQAGVQLIHSAEVAELQTTGGGENAALSVGGNDDEPLVQAAHLQLLRRGHWEYVTRLRGTGVVAVLAVTDQRELVLIEQYRAPVAGNVIELPAGIVGDLDAAPDEPPEQAARRELLEETGYHAPQLELIQTTCSSAGLTDEQVTIYLARNVQRHGPGGGDASESITVHCVPLDQVDSWLRAAASRGAHVDARVFAGLYFLATWA